MDFLKAFPDTLQLETNRVKLRLLAVSDIDQFSQLAKSLAIWKYFTKDLSLEGELRQWIQEALIDKDKERRFPFTILDKQNDAICGSTSVGNISFYDKRIEIGWTWLVRVFSVGNKYRSKVHFAAIFI